MAGTLDEGKIIEYFRNKSVLITGATGFLGKIMVEKILRVQPDVKRIYLPVRAADAAVARRRVETEISQIHHIDAELRLARDLRKQMEADDDVDPKAQRKAMKDLGLTRARHFGWPNTYVFTKSMGEMMLAQMMRGGDVPVVIVRPSIITSVQNDPLPGWIDQDDRCDPDRLREAKPVVLPRRPRPHHGRDARRHGGERNDGGNGGARLHAAVEAGEEAASASAAPSSLGAGSADCVPRELIVAAPGAVCGAVPDGDPVLRGAPTGGARRTHRAHPQSEVPRQHRGVPPLHGAQVSCSPRAPPPALHPLLRPLWPRRPLP